MSPIVVNDDQAQVIFQGKERLEVRDRNGHLLGWVMPTITEELYNEIKRRLGSNEPRYTTEEVLGHLRALEERGL